MGHQYSVVFEHEPDPLDLAFLEERLAEAAVSAAGVGDEQEFAVIVRDGGRIVAGASGAMWGGGCQLHVVWVTRRCGTKVWDETSWPRSNVKRKTGAVGWSWAPGRQHSAPDCSAKSNTTPPQ